MRIPRYVKPEPGEEWQEHYTGPAASLALKQAGAPQDLYEDISWFWFRERGPSEGWSEPASRDGWLLESAGAVSVIDPQLDHASGMRAWRFDELLALLPPDEDWYVSISRVATPQCFSCDNPDAHYHTRLSFQARTMCDELGRPADSLAAYVVNALAAQEKKHGR